MQHFFDGLAMLHKFDIADGKVVHLSRHTADGVARQAKKDGYVNTLLMFGSNANPPPEVMAAANAQLGDAQDPCQALLGRQVMSQAEIGRKMTNTPNSKRFSSPKAT
jgi:hypothetical protein